jgi:uncharacterized SAM-binding protein YcdF (DUF218 family)
MLHWIERILAGFGLLMIVAMLLVFITYVTVPTHNSNLTHFDTIIVLGSPALANGQPSPEERARVMEGVREFKAGRAGHIIFSGGPTENQFADGQVMARVAEEAGVPTDDVVIEGESQNTIQNVFYSHKIMERMGWTSAEVVSSPSHLPRAGLILQHYQFQWQTRAAPWPPEFRWKQIAMHHGPEVVEIIVLRWYGFQPSEFLPQEKTSHWW